MRILIVDDEEHIQRIFAAFLLRYGQDYHVRMDIHSIHDPLQAKQELALHGNGYDLIMLDVRMPKLSGCDICHAVASEHPQLMDRILFITGYPEDLEKTSFSDLNILEKPFRYSQLAEKIGKINNSRQNPAFA